MEQHNWIQSLPAAIIVCDDKGTIVEMNDRAAESHQKEGGRQLIGTNLLECHPEPARSKLAEILKSHTTNMYTVEKGGQKKFVCQAPYYLEGKYAGFVELVFPTPYEIPHFVREQ
jgi:transcriptional regulator with PAS, ATPase and Fis domain